MKRITADMVLAWRPCADYTEEYIRALAGPDGLTVPEVLSLDIPPEHRLWVVLREDVLPKVLLQIAALSFARHVEHLDSSGVATRCNDTTEQYLAGTITEEELQSAAAEADADAADAFAYAAYAYAYARYAAADAAYASSAANAAYAASTADAANASAADAAYAAYAHTATAARAAASAEREWQVTELTRLINAKEIVS